MAWSPLGCGPPPRLPAASPRQLSCEHSPRPWAGPSYGAILMQAAPHQTLKPSPGPWGEGARRCELGPRVLALRWEEVAQGPREEGWTGATSFTKPGILGTPSQPLQCRGGGEGHGSPGRGTSGAGRVSDVCAGMLSSDGQGPGPRLPGWACVGAAWEPGRQGRHSEQAGGPGGALFPRSRAPVAATGPAGCSGRAERVLGCGEGLPAGGVGSGRHSQRSFPARWGPMPSGGSAPSCPSACGAAAARWCSGWGAPPASGSCEAPSQLQAGGSEQAWAAGRRPRPASGG